MNQDNSKFIEDVYKKIKEMNIDNSNQIIELIDLLQHNEIIKCEEYRECPINYICNALGINVYSTNLDNDEGRLYVGGTTKKLYGCNQVILTNAAYSLRKQREIRASLLGVYLLDFLKHFNGDYSKVYIAIYSNTNMDNKAHYFAGELLTPSDTLINQYNIALDRHKNSIYIKTYLREYFNVTSSFVEQRIHEVAYGFSLPIESTNSPTSNPNNIVIFRKSRKRN